MQTPKTKLYASIQILAKLADYGVIPEKNFEVLDTINRVLKDVLTTKVSGFCKVYDFKCNKTMAKIIKILIKNPDFVEIPPAELFEFLAKKLQMSSLEVKTQLIEAIEKSNNSNIKKLRRYVASDTKLFISLYVIWDLFIEYSYLGGKRL